MMKALGFELGWAAVALACLLVGAATVGGRGTPGVSAPGAPGLNQRAVANPCPPGSHLVSSNKYMKGDFRCEFSLWPWTLKCPANLIPIAYTFGNDAKLRVGCKSPLSPIN